MIPNIAGFHIEPTNICTLKCAGCARTQFINQWPNHWKNYSIDIDRLIKFLDVDISEMKINLCGNYGDPIYHPEFLKLVREFKKRECHLIITTNGSYKSQEWWLDLCRLLTPDDTITFSVDGTPENFTKYRQNANWDSILDGMQVVAKHNIKSIWKYILFNYNINDIDQVEHLCYEIGLDYFELSPSDRFDQHTMHLIPPAEFLGTRKSAQDSFKSGKQFSIDPKCKNSKEHFISATGHYSPCCYAADHRFYYKTIFGKDKALFDISKTTMSEILGSTQTIEFYNSIPISNPTVCQFNCPAVD